MIVDVEGGSRSAVLLRFVMRNFLVKADSFTGKRVSETEQKATAFIEEEYTR